MYLTLLPNGFADKSVRGYSCPTVPSFASLMPLSRTFYPGTEYCRIVLHRNYMNESCDIRRKHRYAVCMEFVWNWRNTVSESFRLPPTNNIHPQEVPAAFITLIEFLHISDRFHNILCILWTSILSCFLEQDRKNFFP